MKFGSGMTIDLMFLSLIQGAPDFADFNIHHSGYPRYFSGEVCADDLSVSRIPRHLC
jgi:hypothetical protein